MRIVRNEKILLPVNNVSLLCRKYTRHCQKSVAMVETLRILFIERTRPISKTWNHARSKDSRYTYISRLPEQKQRRCATPTFRTSKATPASILDNAAATRDRSPLLRFPPRPWSRRAMLQPSGNKQSSFRRLTWPHVDAWCRPTLHPVDFEPPLPLGQQCNFFIDTKSPFVSPRGKAGS